MKVGKILEMFKEKDGKVSFSRINGFVILVWIMILVTYVSLTTKTVPDIPYSIAILISALYGFNKIAESLSNRNK